MLMQAINEFQATLTLQSVSPLIVKDGRYGQDQREDWAESKTVLQRMPNVIPISRNRVEEIRTAVTDPNPLGALERLTFFIPGTSLRGAWRAFLERELRSRDLPEKAKICDPFAEGGEFESCSHALTSNRKTLDRNGIHVYSASCPICRLFGSTEQGSRLAISDGERLPRPGMQTPSGELAQNEHVRIDRRVGRVEGAVLKFVGLQDAQFRVSIRLRNFELWQLALVGRVIANVSQIPVGFGKNKGYGRVKRADCSVKFVAFGVERPDGFLRGVAEDRRWGEWAQKRYRIVPFSEPPALAGTSAWRAVSPWRWERLGTIRELFEHASAIFARWEAQWGSLPLLSSRVPAEAQG